MGPERADLGLDSGYGIEGAKFAFGPQLDFNLHAIASASR